MKIGKSAKARTPEHKKFLTDREALKLECFNRKLSEAAQNVEKETAEHAEYFPVKGKLRLSELDAPSLDEILICDAVFEHAHIRLILSDYPSLANVDNLNKSSKSFTDFRRVFLYAEFNIFFKLFQHDPDCA